MRFASLKSANPSVRARLQAALFTNRKRNRLRRVPLESSPWGAGILTVGQVSETHFGYNSYDEPPSGSLVQPNQSNTINYMVEESWFGTPAIVIEFSGKEEGVFEGSSLNIFGNVYPFFTYLDITGSENGCYVIFSADPILDSEDIGNSFNFTFTFAD